jgi:hypothetical protein
MRLACGDLTPRAGLQAESAECLQSASPATPLILPQIASPIHPLPGADTFLEMETPIAALRRIEKALLFPLRSTLDPRCLVAVIQGLRY